MHHLHTLLRLHTLIRGLGRLQMRLLTILELKATLTGLGLFGIQVLPLHTLCLRLELAAVLIRLRRKLRMVLRRRKPLTAAGRNLRYLHRRLTFLELNAAVHHLHTTSRYDLGALLLVMLTAIAPIFRLSLAF